MPDPDKPLDEPRLPRSKRRAAVIDLKAEEVPPAASAEMKPPEPAPAEKAPAAEPDPAAAGASQAEAGPEVAAKPEAGTATAEARPERPQEFVRDTVQEPLRVPPAPEPKRSLALPLTAAALAGLVFGGVGGTLAPMFFGDGNGASSARLDILDRTQQQLARDQAGLASTLELDKLRQAVTKLEADVAERLAAVGQQPSPLEPRLSALEAEVRALAARPAPPAPAAPASAAPPVDLAPIRQQLAALDQRVGAATGLQQRIGGLDDRLNALDTQLKTLGDRLEAVDGRIAANAQAAEAATQAARSAATAAEPKIAALGQRIDEAAARIENSRAAPLFSAVQALALAFHRGAPYQPELSAAEALGASPEQLAPLRPFAERGAPTPQRLQEAFAPLAGKLAGDADQPGVWGYVSRFVTIRPTEETAGASPAAITGSIEAALRRGDAAAAHAAWSRLPEAARNASAEWGRLAGRRVAAAKALADLQASASAALRK